MEAYRDQYATLFKGGKGVAVIAVSTDADTVQFDWARDEKFPVYFASDPDAAVGKRYGVKLPLVNYEKRVVFVIGKDGRITHVMNPFRELVGDAYTELGTAVDSALKASGAGP